MNSIVVRKAKKEDVPEMMVLIKELAEFENGLNEVSVDEDNLLKYGFSDEALYSCFIAEKNGAIKGMALYFYTYSTWNGKCLYLEDLIVKRKERTNGVGTALMNEIIKTGKEEKANRIAWQVLDWNLDAHDFYRKFDASLDGEWLNGRMTLNQIKAFRVK